MNYSCSRFCFVFFLFFLVKPGIIKSFLIMLSLCVSVLQIASLRVQAGELGQEETVQKCLENGAWVEGLFDRFGELINQVQQACGWFSLGFGLEGKPNTVQHRPTRMHPAQSGNRETNRASPSIQRERDFNQGPVSWLAWRMFGGLRSKNGSGWRAGQ